MSPAQETSRSGRVARRLQRGSRRAQTNRDILRFDFASRSAPSEPVVLARYFRIKAYIDRAITASLMVVALPVMAVVGLSVLALDGRPVFYRQNRVGKDGRLFRIWKFRTMRPDAENHTGAVWSCHADPRVTKLGQWLRSSHLDELPQLFNVLTGDMNLIGPRPERPEFVSELAKQVPCYAQRTKVAPGITGLAQIRTGYDHSVADVRKKVEIDLEYLRFANFGADIKLLTSTAMYILKHLWEARRRVRQETEARRLAPQCAASEPALVGPSCLLGGGISTVFNLSIPFPNSTLTAQGESPAIEILTKLVHEIEECP